MSKEIENNTTYISSEFKESLEGIKYVALIDVANKRRIKKSAPTLILNKIESLNGATLKEIENALAKSPTADFKKSYNSANSVRIAKGFEPYAKIRDFVIARLTAVKRYYTAENVVRDVFNGIPPLVSVNENGKENFYLTYREVKVKA